MHARVAEIDHMAEDEDREKGERDKGEEYVKGNRRDNNIPMVLLVFFEEFFDDIENRFCFAFFNHNLYPGYGQWVIGYRNFECISNLF
jgi:hypothetical protein